MGFSCLQCFSTSPSTVSTPSLLKLLFTKPAVHLLCFSLLLFCSGREKKNNNPSIEMFFSTTTLNHNWVNEAVIFAASAISAEFYRERDSASPALVTVIISQHSQTKSPAERHERRESKDANKRRRISEFGGSRRWCLSLADTELYLVCLVCTVYRKNVCTRLVFVFMPSVTLISALN